jgi:hypothetical protein
VYHSSRRSYSIDIDVYMVGVSASPGSLSRVRGLAVSLGVSTSRRIELLGYVSRFLWVDSFSSVLGSLGLGLSGLVWGLGVSVCCDFGVLNVASETYGELAGGSSAPFDVSDEPVKHMVNFR